VSEATVELVQRGVGSLRRSAFWWGVGLVLLVAVTAASWPGLEGTDALESFEDMGAILDAFGAQNLATPAGYLDGQVYAFMLPVLLSVLAIVGLTAVTAGDEDAGRMECLLALPVTRHSVWLTRWAASVLVVAAVGATTLLVMVVLRPLVSLEEVSIGRLATATLACVLLAVFHAGVAFAAAGRGAARGLAAGIAAAVLIAGYVMSLLLPLVDGLEGARKWSPWYWALADQPVSNGVDAGWLALLVAVTAVLVAAGALLVERRDIRSA
jgi:ABC-2 type transport system permease protein